MTIPLATSMPSRWLQVSHVLVLARISGVAGDVYHCGYAERPTSLNNSSIRDIPSTYVKAGPKPGSASTSLWVGICLLKRAGKVVILITTSYTRKLRSVLSSYLRYFCSNSISADLGFGLQRSMSLLNCKKWACILIDLFVSVN